MLTLSYILNALPLSFKYGDSDILKGLMLKDDHDFLRFKGKDQFDKKVKAIYPDIKIDDLYEDYITNRRICFSIYRYCQDYYLHGDVLELRFCYEDSIDENTGDYYETAFKVLDGVTRPYLDDFWNTFLPPNHVGDKCSVTTAYKEEITPVPFHLPQVDKRFVCDLKGLFLSKITPKLPEKLSETDSINLLKSFGIDFEKMVYDQLARQYPDVIRLE